MISRVSIVVVSADDVSFIVSTPLIVGLTDSLPRVAVKVSVPVPPAIVSTVSSEPAVEASKVSSPEPVVNSSVPVVRVLAWATVSGSVSSFEIVALTAVTEAVRLEPVKVALTVSSLSKVASPLTFTVTDAFCWPAEKVTAPEVES